MSKLENFFSKKVGEAIFAYNMIDDADNVLVGVSGGKDSMSLLKILRYKQTRLPVKYGLKACYVDMGMDDARRRTVESYLKDNGYDYVVEQAGEWQSRRKRNGSLNCYWCAFHRRKKLFETADRLGCKKIALGHHKDDIVETLLLNVFFHGEISAMLPNQEFFKGAIHIIRPLSLCDEKFVTNYAKHSNFPQIPDNCPNSGNTKRALMKELLSMAEKHNKDVKTNIFRSMQNINLEYLPKGESYGYRKKKKVKDELE